MLIILCLILVEVDVKGEKTIECICIIYVYSSLSLVSKIFILRIISETDYKRKVGLLYKLNVNIKNTVNEEPRMLR